MSLELRPCNINFSVLLKQILLGAIKLKKIVARMEKELLPWKMLCYAKKHNDNLGKKELRSII